MNTKRGISLNLKALRSSISQISTENRSRTHHSAPVWVLTLAINAALLMASAPVKADSVSGEQPTEQVKTVPHGKARLKVGLALGGGGARGFAHIGVLKVLQAHGIPIDCVAGTSMGSIIGGLFCAGLTCDQINKVVREKPFAEIFEHVHGKLGLAVLPIAVVPKALTASSYDGLYKGTKFANFIDTKIPPDSHDIEHLPIEFAAVTFNLIDGKTCSLRAGDLGTAIQASSTLPELRQPIAIQGRLLVDGGVTSNLPSTQVREMGADVVIAVNVDERLAPVSDAQFRGIGSVSDRCLEANLIKLDEDSEKRADALIHPEVSGIKLLSRSTIDMERAIMEGEKAANAALPEILALLKSRNIELVGVPQKQEPSVKMIAPAKAKTAHRFSFM